VSIENFETIAKVDGWELKRGIFRTGGRYSDPQAAYCIFSECGCVGYWNGKVRNWEMLNCEEGGCRRQPPNGLTMAFLLRESRIIA
jgi:hypothetical protein